MQRNVYQDQPAHSVMMTSAQKKKIQLMTQTHIPPKRLQMLKKRQTKVIPSVRQEAMPHRLLAIDERL